MIAGALEEIRQAPTTDLVVTLTLVITLVHNPGLAAPFVAVLVVSGLVYRHLALRCEFWFVLAAIRALSVGPPMWFTIDNHHYLLTYWFVALGVALLANRSPEVLAFTGRMLLGLTFAIAVLWKVISPDFLTGSFFEFSLVTDRRLLALSRAIGGITMGDMQANRDAIALLVSPDGPASVTLTSHPLIIPAAKLIGIGTIALEGLVAVLLLGPKRLSNSALRHAAILGFVWTTYALAPVIGFAWIVLTLAIAQTRSDEPIARTAYVLSFLVIPAFSYGFTLGALAGPTIAALVSVVLFLSYVHTGRPLLRDASLAWLGLGGGLLIQVHGGVSHGIVLGLAAATVIATSLRLAVPRRPRPHR